MHVKLNVKRSVSAQLAAASSSASVNHTQLGCNKKAAWFTPCGFFYSGTAVIRYAPYQAADHVRPDCVHNAFPFVKGPALLKFRLFRRRLTISSPRMAVRSSLPWPVRWILGAVMLGFSGAIALWAFEFGKGITGLDMHSREELQQLRAEVSVLRIDREKAQSIANTSGSLLTAEKAAQEKMAEQIRQLEADNLSLRDDLGFFEKLLPANGTDGISIRSLQAEMVSGSQLKWQILVIQPVKGAAEFHGKLDITVSGMLAGKAWTASLPGGSQVLQLKQYRRVEGLLDVPPQAVVQTVTAKILEGNAARSVQTFKLK
jgi:hypothetical protein